MPYVPRIDLESLPDDEHVSAQYIQSNLGTLAWNTQELAVSFELYFWAAREASRLQTLRFEDFVRPNGDVDQEAAHKSRRDASIIRQWQTIALRNGALLIYSYYRVTQYIDGLKGQTPTLLAKLDQQKLDAAHSEFDQHFPGIGKLRNSVAHPGEQYATPDRAARSGPAEQEGQPFSGPLSMTGTILVNNGRVSFASTVDGKLLEYEVSEQKLHQLQRISDLWFQAYYPAERGPPQMRYGESDWQLR